MIAKIIFAIRAKNILKIFHFILIILYSTAKIFTNLNNTMNFPSLLSKIIKSIKSYGVLIVFYLVCLITCFLQVYEICEKYFLYETLTSVTFAKRSEISLPAVTICVNKFYIFNDSYKSELNFDQDKNYTRFEFLKKINEFSIEKQFQILYSAEEVFSKSVVLKTKQFSQLKDVFINCGKVSPIRRYIDYFDSCFTFLSQMSGETVDKYVVENDAVFRDASTQLFEFKIIPTIPEVDLTIHSRKWLIQNRYKREKLRLFNSKHDYYYIVYNKVVVHSLPTPYETNCFDFRSINYSSHSDCIGKCRAMFLHDHFKIWPAAYLNDDQTSQVIIKDVWSRMRENLTIDHEIGRKCKESCGTQSECHSEYFRFDQEHFEYHTKFFEIRLSIPLVPDLVYRHSPKMKFVEFCCFIASIISLWFGFSLIMVSDLFSIIMNYWKVFYCIHFENNRVFSIRLNTQVNYNP